jgi:hypothetical protein
MGRSHFCVCIAFVENGPMQTHILPQLDFPMQPCELRARLVLAASIETPLGRQDSVLAAYLVEKGSHHQARALSSYCQEAERY